MIRAFLFLLLLATTEASQAQPFVAEPVEDENLVYILNRVEVLGEKTRNDLIIRILSVGDLPGSAGAENGEITHTIYIGVSGLDELPAQRLFRLAGLFNPRLELADSREQSPIIVSYGPAEHRERIAILASLDDVNVTALSDH